MLTNLRYGTYDAKHGWAAMRDAMEAAGVERDIGFTALRNQARETPSVKRLENAMKKVSAEWVKAREAGKPQSTLDRLTEKYNDMSERYKKLLHETERKIETAPYHEFYKKNAAKYGFKYEFRKR